MRSTARSIVFIAAFGAGFTVAWIGLGDETPRVVYAKQLEMDAGERCRGTNAPSTPQKSEVFIVQDAPKDRVPLMTLIKQNEVFTPIDKNEVEMRYTLFHRVYYRESRKTPVDFQDGHGGYFSRDYISDHVEDKICEIFMQQRDWMGVPDSLRLTWTCNCTETGDTLVEYRSAKP